MEVTITLGIGAEHGGPALGILKPQETVDDGAHEAATSPENDRPQPSLDQQKAGNYKVGPVRVGGLAVSIENPAGSTRSGTSRDGKSWSTEMHSHYGYILGTKGKDKDCIDCFIKTGTPRELPGKAPVFVIDQVKPGNRHFDEHKVMIGWPTKAQAKRAYQANYERGWNGLGAITEMTLDAFKAWLRGDTTKPAAKV